MTKYNILKKWKKDCRNIIKMRYPEATKEQIDAYLYKVIKSNLKDEKVAFNNSYTKENFTSSVLDITEYCHKYKPIPTEHGCLFDPVKENPAAIVLEKWAMDRKAFKKEMYEYEKGSFMFNLFDLKQLLKKIEMNSYYGVSGTRSSVFFNLDIALSITGKGQTLISVATMAFEMFLANNVLFRNMDECLIFIKNTVKEKRKYNDSEILDHDIRIEVLYEKLLNTFENREDCDRGMLISILSNLSKQDRNRLYYKNNIYEFFRNSYPKQLLNTLFSEIDVFNDPNKVPNYIKPEVDHIYDLLKEFVLYNYQIIDRGHRLKTQKRKAVIVIDTDSNMINMNPWYIFVLDEILSDDVISSKDKDNLRHAIIFILVNICSSMIADVLEKFLASCNVPKHKQRKLVMKSEYLYSRMMISEGKKNYAAIMEYKEGKFAGNTLDAKGLAIGKSVTNIHAAKFFEKILEFDILKSEQIDVSHILTKLNYFENEVKQSLAKGEKKFLKPMSLKDISSYKDPFKEQQVVAALIWNFCYPESEILAPEKFDIVKLTLNKEEQLEKIKDDYPEIYDALKDNVFSKRGKENFNKGCHVLAIPHSIKNIPEWAVPFIDIETMADNTMSPMIPVLRTLQAYIIKDSNNLTFSNVINF